MGFSEESEMQTLLFIIFLSMHLITVFGNLLIIIAVHSDCHLHNPMYFFLSNLSFVNICFTSTAIPKMLWSIQTQSKVITYEGCSTYFHFFLTFCQTGYLSPDSDGLWLICSHLPLPALHSHHEPPALWTAGAGVLDHQCPEFLFRKLNGVVTGLL